ncbi:hypothetical protein SETIT_2G058200v2 [Setaria italica]|uniref:Uncharacterized protein n=1 Tax=Setaria italica TaxID=4555 RepID=A0A368PVW4_SETIT|nr:hypothetical protein SETIT_2G058200v2 [Setaria italica]
MKQLKQPVTLDFPGLKRIHLHELPRLHSICGVRMSAPNLETIKIRGCWSLKRLPDVGGGDKAVECDCEKEWWDRLEWDDGLAGDPLQADPLAVLQEDPAQELCSPVIPLAHHAIYKVHRFSHLNWLIIVSLPSCNALLSNLLQMRPFTAGSPDSASAAVRLICV